MSDIRDMSILEVSPFHRIALYKSTFTDLLYTDTTDTLNKKADEVNSDLAGVTHQSSKTMLSLKVPQLHCCVFRTAIVDLKKITFIPVTGRKQEFQKLC